MQQAPRREDVLRALGAMAPAEREAVLAEAIKSTCHLAWLPAPGPQTQAFYSPAEVLLYGGQGGGGKTDLGLGLAFTQHRRSLILRRQYTNLSGLTVRAIEINGSRDCFNGSPRPNRQTTNRGPTHVATCP